LISVVHIGPLEIGTHGLFVALGVSVAVVILWVRAGGRRMDRTMASLIAGGLFSGAILAKLGTGWQYLVSSDDPSLLGLLVDGGQSVLGGLAGAYFGVVVTKRFIGYRHSTGDWFAPGVAGGLAVGRIGCFLTEQIGTPTGLPWGLTVSPELANTMPYCPSCALGQPMHPSFLYEIAFHVVAFVLLIRYGGRVVKPGDSFKVYLLAYALFRFAVEFVRDNPEMAFGLTGSQLFLLTTVPLGTAAYLWKRTRSPRLVLEPAR